MIILIFSLNFEDLEEGRINSEFARGNNSEKATFTTLLTFSTNDYEFPESKRERDSDN